MATTMTRYALVRRRGGRVGLDALARDAGLHPELARRLVALGVVEPVGGSRANPLFAGDAAARLARAARLRRDLGLNYAGAVLACDLLARIDDLEAELGRRRPQRLPEVIRWIPTS
jgi:chaperone modulatory protein CbpM